MSIGITEMALELRSGEWTRGKNAREIAQYSSAME